MFSLLQSIPIIHTCIKNKFGNFQYSKTMSNIFEKKKLLNSLSQASSLLRIIFRSKFESQQKDHKVKNCAKNCVSCLYFLKASLYLFIKIKKTFLLKNFWLWKHKFNFCSHLLRTQIRIYKRNGVFGERANKFLLTTYKTATISTIGSWRLFTYLWRQKV